MHYEKAIIKVENNSLRIKFLENCRRAELIPKFLKFRIPNNGCFDDKSVRSFQLQLLRKELVKAREDFKTINQNLDVRREQLRSIAPKKCLPSIVLHTRISRSKVRREQLGTHNKKLNNLSEEQERPLFNVQNTVVLWDIDNPPPEYVMQTLSLGPKNAILDQFDPKDILAEVDQLLNHCEKKNTPDEIITDINVKTINYIKKCKQTKPSRNVMMTQRYLKNNSLLAIPFDKGVGICLMKKETYFEKMNSIINLPQFEKTVNKQKKTRNTL